MIQPLFMHVGLGPKVLERASKLRLPTISDADGFAEAGGLMFYGADPVSVYQRLAVYIDRVLKGANPASIPIEQPKTYLLVVNLKSARAQGLKIPETILLRADKVLE